MKKFVWSILSIAVVLVAATVTLSVYLVHDLAFEQKVDCATGEASYGFLTPVCNAYMSAFVLYDTPEDRRKMSANLHRLMTAYDLDSEGIIGQNALELADRFIQLGADVNFVDAQGGTPLHTAVLHGDAELVRFLLDRGADADQRRQVDFLGETVSPLELARNIKLRGNDSKHWDEIIALLEAGTFASGSVPLHSQAVAE